MIKNLLKKLKFPWYTTSSWDSYFAYWIENPIGTWWKARKYFKRPKMSIYVHKVSKTHGYPYATYHWIGRILDIRISDVEYKDKYGSPRYEFGPLVYICLFRKIAFSIHFNIWYIDEFGNKKDGNSFYWEYLIQYLYYENEKTLKCYSTWTTDSKLYKHIVKYGDSEDGKDDIVKPLSYVIPCVAMSLNKRGRKELKKELEQ